MRFAFILLIVSVQVAIGESVEKQARDLVDRMEVSKRPSKKPSLGVLGHWEFHLNTFQHKIEPSTIHDLYYKACRKMEAFYQGKIVTYLERDEMGWPVQTTIVQLQSEELGDSHIIALV
jgi:hypothetical protein